MIDFRLALQTLNAFHVDYVLVGGLAGRLWGSPVVTEDLDICPARDAKNLHRLAQALDDLEAKLRGAPAGLPFLLDAETLAKGGNFTFATRIGDLDIVAFPAGVTGYDELMSNAVDLDLDGLSVWVAELEDLMRMKRAAGREKDKDHLRYLEAIRDRRESES